MIDLLMAFTALTTATARAPLTLNFEVEVQRRVVDPASEQWATVTKVKAEGIAGLQSYLDPQTTHRLVITVFKPQDLKGSFKVRTPLRVDGVTLDLGRSAQLILGPHTGCPDAEARCKPFTEEEVGQIEMRMDLEKAKQTAFGILAIRPYSQPVEEAVRTALVFKDKTIPCGATVEKGWWIFASSVYSSANPKDTISLCVQEPDGDIECADDEEFEIGKKMNQTGQYEFVVWNSSPTVARCFVRAQ